ncbi:autoinducer binding domain-containing protein [Jannaschia sp. LMIT008]|uniref:autoinducer binding domain-containing protein n=1 Tax=Jannaschia maritima TaxID=3032585 RepID=UPI002810AC48|nr:autoinducer binding domain-containing protein [Jannaschia sp. LMIT008]
MQSLEQLAPSGFSAGLHIRFAAPLFFRSTYPRAWQDRYSSNNFGLRDPLVFWGISQTGAIRWSAITLPDPFGILRQAQEHGLTYGVVVSCGKITSRSVVGAARTDREFSDAEIAEIQAVAADLHAVTRPPDDLSAPMVDALRAVALGDSQPGAAAALGITEGALTRRLSSARQTLGVETTDEALRMAREYRLF